MNGVTVGLVLLVDVALAGAGSWMIYDHLRKPAVGPAPAVVAAPDARVTVAAAPPPAPAPAPSTPPRREAPPPPVATTAVPPERPQPERTSPAPTKSPSPGRLPDKPAALPVQTFPDAGVPPHLPPMLRPRPDAAVAPLPPPPPSPPDAALPPPAIAEPPDAAPAAVGPSAPDPAWVESMTRGIRNVVEDHRADIEDCYGRTAKEATRESPIQGRVEVHLTIVPSGDAEDVRVVENQTGSEELGTCLVSIMRSWRYPAPGQESMEFVWPFNFQARTGTP